MTIDETRALFAHDLYATQQTGVRITEAGERHAVCELTVAESHRNAMGSVMGGAVFTLADLAFAAAANHGGLQWVSVCSTINYLAAATEGVLRAEARCVKEGRRSCVYTIEVSDACGRRIALVTTTGTNVSTPTT